MHAALLKLRRRAWHLTVFVVQALVFSLAISAICMAVVALGSAAN